MPDCTAAEVVTLGKDIVVAVAAMIGGVVAILGISTWKRQLKGTTEYELARRLLRAALAARDEMSNFRRPFMPASELSAALAESDVDAIPSSNEAIRVAYILRWNKVAGAVQALRVEALEAEVLWGQEIRETIDELGKSAGLLNAALTMHLMSLNEGESASGESKLRETVFRDLYDQSAPENPDAFKDTVNDVIAKIETLAKPHLRK